MFEEINADFIGSEFGKPAGEKDGAKKKQPACCFLSFAGLDLCLE